MKDIAIDFAALSPPIQIAADGSLRRVGVEIESLDPSAHVAAQALAHDLSGACETIDPHAVKVTGTHLGDLLIETGTRNSVCGLTGEWPLGSASSFHPLSRES